MILMDYSGTMHAVIAVEVGFDPAPGTVVDEGLIRHMLLKSIKKIRSKFKDDYGELVIALDGKNYWRGQVFNYYKHNRKEQRKDSPLDWDTIHKSMDKIKNELKEYFPYRVIQVDEAEADDIIGTLVKNVTDEPIIIISKDQDMIQLHDEFGGRIRQYAPTGDAFVEHSDPKQYLKEKIIKGDSGDGVPNVMMPDDTFMTKTRQKPITAKRLEEFSRDLPRGIGDDDMLRNYKRNKLLIDLSNTPSDISKEIMQIYEKEAGKNRKKLMGYFVEKRLKNLMQDIQDF